MKLQNEFSVAAPIDRTWEMLLDIQRVAQCLPGATMDPADGDGVHRGAMKMRLGPITVDYRGTAKLADVDEDDRVATIDVKGKEAKGQGTASALIRNSLAPTADGTKVTVETDLNVTGRQAQFGRGIMEDIATRMLGDFAERLERELQEGLPASTPVADATTPAPGVIPAAPTAAPASAPRVAGPFEPAVPEETLDLGSVVAGPLAKRAAGAAGLLLVLAGLVAALRPRRRRLSVTVRYR